MVCPGCKVGLLVLLIVGLCARVIGQDRSNPFEITSRLPADTSSVGQPVNDTTGYSPFDIRPSGQRPATAPPSANTAPAPPCCETVTVAPNAERPRSAERRSGPLIIPPNDRGSGRGAVLAIHLILLIALASLWVLFGNLLAQVLRGTLNDNLLNQIYARRSGGEETTLWICHLFFFLTAGFYVHLFAAHYAVAIHPDVWLSWLTCSAGVAGLVALKRLVVYMIGGLFPIRKDTSKYAFVLLVFSVLIGIVFVPINLAVSYAPEAVRVAFLYGGLAVVALLYGLHLVRGLLVAGPLATSRPLHLILYICAVEIAPLLLFYRYFSSLSL